MRTATARYTARVCTHASQHVRACIFLFCELELELDMQRTLGADQFWRHLCTCLSLLLRLYSRQSPSTYPPILPSNEITKSSRQKRTSSTHSRNYRLAYNSVDLRLVFSMPSASLYFTLGVLSACHLVGPLVTFSFFLDLSFLSSSLMFAPDNKWP